MESTRKLRRELGYELAKLQVLQESVDEALDDESAKTLASQIREQAGICLSRLDHYQASVPARMWSAEGKLQPLRDDLRRTERVFRVHSGEYERRSETRSYAHRPFDWLWDDISGYGPDDRSGTNVLLHDGTATGEASLLAPSGDDVEAQTEIREGRIALVDDEDPPDEDMATGSLRFTLPMAGGTPEQNMLVLLPCETGLIYSHQYGGSHRRHVEIEGFLVPAWANAEARAALDQQFLVELGGNGVQDDDRSEALKKVSDAIGGIWYGGTDDRMVPLRIDERRAHELDEAWVPVLTPDGPAYLAWVNSD